MIPLDPDKFRKYMDYCYEGEMHKYRQGRTLSEEPTKLVATLKYDISKGEFLEPKSEREFIPKKESE